MEPVVLYSMPGNEARAEDLARACGERAVVAAVSVHRFPDGETLVRVQPPAAGARVVLVCSLNDPDARTVPLLMAAATLRELGAASVGLLAPYLAYMRQDRSFEPGQAVSARHYARLLSAHFDWLLTVDPHLHRIHDLSEIYTVPARVLHAAPVLADWIRREVARPLIIGPDGESAQWATDVAARVGAPVVVVDKLRNGDRDVASTPPALQSFSGLTPVLLDDIASSGRTLVAVLEHLRGAGLAPPVCAVVHGLFAGDALQAMRAAGAARIACTDTTSGIDRPGVDIVSLTEPLAQAMLELAAACAPRNREEAIP